jgi:Putative zinc-finger
MKCEVCLSLLEEYLDEELAARDASEVGAHLITCPTCADEFATLSAEQDLFARYDREVEVPPSLWATIAERTAPLAERIVPEKRKGWRARVADLLAIPSYSAASAIAVLFLAIAMGAAYVIMHRTSSKKELAKVNRQETIPSPAKVNEELSVKDVPASAKEPKSIAAKLKPSHGRSSIKSVPIDQSDVLSSDFAYLDLDDQDTAKHIEQTQNLLRSIRNVPVSYSDDEIDVTYDKALSRRLLNENVVLRRDAEMKAKFPTKTLLSDLEPFLIDIANLPDRAKPEEVLAIKERVQKTEIVAALLDYQDRGTNNR